MKNWTKVDQKLFMTGIIAGGVITGIGFITDITFLIVIGGVFLFGSMYGKYFR
jgi:hypothetical protein